MPPSHPQHRFENLTIKDRILALTVVNKKIVETIISTFQSHLCSFSQDSKQTPKHQYATRNNPLRHFNSNHEAIEFGQKRM